MNPADEHLYPPKGGTGGALGPSALVLSPTRELCLQIADDLRDLMRIATEDNKRGRGKRELIGEEPDFSEEGWARRKPKKKK